MAHRTLLPLALIAVVVASCASQPETAAPTSGGRTATPEDFGEVARKAFERNPNLRKVPEGEAQDSMIYCVMEWASRHSTVPPAELMHSQETMDNAAEAWDLIAAADWDALAPYCGLSRVKSYLP